MRQLGKSGGGGGSGVESWSVLGTKRIKRGANCNGANCNSPAMIHLELDSDTSKRPAHICNCRTQVLQRRVASFG